MYLAKNNMRGRCLVMRKILAIVASNNKKSRTKEVTNQIICDIKASGSGFTCELVHLSDYNISECDGCQSCFIKGFCKICEDDMKIIIDKLNSSDIVIWACPSYLDNVPGCFKKLLDRMAHFTHTMDFSGKLAFVIITTSNSGSEEIRRYLFKIFPYMGFKMIDCYKFIGREKSNSKYINNVSENIIHSIKMCYGFSNIDLEKKFNMYKELYFKNNKRDREDLYEVNYWNQKNVRQSKNFQEFAHMIRNNRSNY